MKVSILNSYFSILVLYFDVFLKRIRDLVEKEGSKSVTEEKELHAIIINYQKKAREMSEKIGDLEKKLEVVSSSDDQKSSEKSRSAKIIFKNHKI